MVEKTFEEFVIYWKQQGYEVHVTKDFLADLEEIDRPFTLQEVPSLPFELAENLLTWLPRNKVTSWLSSWMATLAIMANRPLYQKIRRRRSNSHTYRIA